MRIHRIRNKQMKQCLWLGLFASLLVIAFTLISPDIFTDWELKTFDYRMRARGEIKTNPDIILIDIDDRSINSIGRWPWDRSIHAKMIEILTYHKAGTIAYDILFHQPSDKKSDDLLVKSTEKSERVYYPVGFDFSTSNLSGVESNEERQFQYLKSYGLGRFIGDTKELLSVKRAITPIDRIAEVSKGLGHISSNRDKDGIIRRVPLVVEIDGVLFPSFSLMAVMDYLNIPKENIVIRPANNITLKGALFPEEKKRRDIIIPVDEKGMMLINYAGPWAHTFDHYSFKNVFAGYDSHNREELFDFKDALILLNNAASGYDIKPIPLENNYPGGGIHANIINTILTENFLKEVKPLIKMIIIVVLGMIGALSGLFVKWFCKMISFLLLLTGYIMVSFYLFASSGVVIQILSPGIAFIMAGMFVSFYQIQSERNMVLSLSREKQNLMRELADVSQKLTEKEKEISGILGELCRQEHHKANLQLKEKLRKERDKKEILVKKRIIILRKLSPSEFEGLRQEAKRFHIITKNRKLLEAVDLALRVAPTDHGVLLLGESGTGKELFARAIHAMSKRNQRELITVNVASIVSTLAESELFGHLKGAFAGAERNRDGLFRKADKGTIFLDEIGDLHPDIQAKLLRVLQDGEIRPVGSSKSLYIDVRVIAATDKNLEMEVRLGKFHKALFSRLNRYPIILPPLRERSEDISSLVHEFIKRHKGARIISGLSQEAIDALGQYTWPENVRQLENVIIRAIINTKNEKLQKDDIRYAMEQELYTGYEAEERNEAYVKVEDRGDEKAVIGGAVERENEPLLKKANGKNDLIDQLRKTQFKIKKTAGILKKSRSTVTDNFKGICFQYIVEHQGNIKETALAVAGGNPDMCHKVEKKIRIYYKNLLSNIKGCRDAEEAKEKCKKIFKNIPNEYFQFIDIMVDQYMKIKK